MGDSDSGLVSAALAGDRSAFGALVNRHRPLLRRLGHRKLADDVYYAALAARLGVPIYVDTAVMARAGLAPDGSARELGEGWQPVDGQAVFQPRRKPPDRGLRIRRWPWSNAAATSCFIIQAKPERGCGTSPITNLGPMSAGFFT